MLTDEIQKKLATAEKAYTFTIIRADKEPDESMFVLWYAFYKDLASTHRVTIPTYAACLEKYKKVRDHSWFVTALEDITPIGILWFTQSHSLLEIQAWGTTQYGRKTGVDLALLKEAVTYGKKTKGMEIRIADENDFPHPDNEEQKDFFHAIISL